MKFNVACIQTNTQNNMQDNIKKATDMATQAASQGADLITMPENVSFMSSDIDNLRENTYGIENHPAVKSFKELAEKLDKWLLIGSIALRVDGSEKCTNTSLLVNNNGEISSRYDKIHLYEASIKGGETHSEPKRFDAGNKKCIADTPWGKIGLTICYDMRFPHLYRQLAQSDVGIITAPSAFTQFTGKAHWHVLLRARAIENGCFIIAPAQTGTHPANRTTYGHSLIIDPWGNILSDGKKDEGVSIASIDTDLIHEVRQQLPSLQHDRNFD